MSLIQGPGYVKNTVDSSPTRTVKSKSKDEFISGRLDSASSKKDVDPKKLKLGVAKTLVKTVSTSKTSQNKTPSNAKGSSVSSLKPNQSQIKTSSKTTKNLTPIKNKYSTFDRSIPSSPINSDIDQLILHCLENGGESEKIAAASRYVLKVTDAEGKVVGFVKETANEKADPADVAASKIAVLFGRDNFADTKRVNFKKHLGDSHETTWIAQEKKDGSNWRSNRNTFTAQIPLTQIKNILLMLNQPAWT